MLERAAIGWPYKIKTSLESLHQNHSPDRSKPLAEIASLEVPFEFDIFTPQDPIQFDVAAVSTLSPQFHTDRCCSSRYADRNSNFCRSC
jgi:hypothetical protein